LRSIVSKNHVNKTNITEKPIIGLKNTITLSQDVSNSGIAITAAKNAPATTLKITEKTLKN